MEYKMLVHRDGNGLITDVQFARAGRVAIVQREASHWTVQTSFSGFSASREGLDEALAEAALQMIAADD